VIYRICIGSETNIIYIYIYMKKFFQRKVGKRIEKEEIKRIRKTFVIKVVLNLKKIKCNIFA